MVYITKCYNSLIFLPPDYEVRREVIFSVCFSVHEGGGIPHGLCLRVPSLASGSRSFLLEGVPVVLPKVLLKAGVSTPPPPLAARTRTGVPLPGPRTGVPRSAQHTPRTGYAAGGTPPSVAQDLLVLGGDNIF